MPAKKPSSGPLALTSIRQIRALAHTVRFKVFEQLIDAPQTGKQLATALKTKPTHLYYHLKVLERARLIRRVSTRKIRGTTEKYYQAVSDQIVIDERLFAGRVVAKQALRAEVLRTVSAELVEADRLVEQELPEHPVLLKRLKIRLARSKIEQVRESLDELLASLESADNAGADAEYALTLAFYPTRIGADESPRT